MEESEMPAKNETQSTIELQRLTDSVCIFPIVGITPVIPHKWSEKAINMMATKQAQTGVRTKREAKDPEQEAIDSCYWIDTDDGRVAGMPATAFKAAMVSACRFFDGLSMVQAKLLFYVEGEGADQLVRITGDATMRTDTPRNATGVADLRYRYAFYPWSANIAVRFLPSVISEKSIVALLDAAGRGGVGDWRPSSPKSATGTFGQWRIDA